MNRLTRLAAASAALAVVMGCGNEEPRSGAEVTAQDVGKQAQEAASTAAQYARQEKAEFVKSAEQTMSELKANMAGLKKDAESASGEAKAQLDKQIAALEEKWAATQSRLDELKNASGEAWQEMKRGLSDALADLKRSYNEAAEEFKNKA